MAKLNAKQRRERDALNAYRIQVHKFITRQPPSEWDEVLTLGGMPELRDTQMGRYYVMRLDNQSHNIAIMLATRSFPGVRSDAIFNEGRFSSDAGKNGAEQLWLKEQAESRGFSTNGKTYMKGLASFPGDPTAWVDGMSDVRRIAKEKNLTVHGYVEQKGHEVAPMDDVPIDPKLVHAETMDVLENYEGAKYQDVYERIHEVRTGAVDNNPLIVQG